jgi:hypothetical protein
MKAINILYYAPHTKSGATAGEKILGKKTSAPILKSKNTSHSCGAVGDYAHMYMPTNVHSGTRIFAYWPILYSTYAVFFKLCKKVAQIFGHYFNFDTDGFRRYFSQTDPVTLIRAKRCSSAQKMSESKKLEHGPMITLLKIWDQIFR